MPSVRGDLPSGKQPLQRGLECLPELRPNAAAQRLHDRLDEQATTAARGSPERLAEVVHQAAQKSVLLGAASLIIAG